MSAVLREQWWENGRLHRVWMEPQADGNIRVVHERLLPPAHIARHAEALQNLRFSKGQRAREDDGLHQIAKLTQNERDEMVKAGIKLGDTDGVKWALKQDQWRHAKVSK